MTDASAEVIAIDGPGGAGKGTIARAVAGRLGWHLLDSGAIYRLLALASLRAGVEPDQHERLVALASALDIRFPATGRRAGAVILDGEVVTDAIRAEACGERASVLAAEPAVREALLARQRAFRKPPGLVADGRDMGTVVFPDAPLKIFLTATAEERARRRHKQLMEQGVAANLDDLLQELIARDQRDTQRRVAPLRPAEDAVRIDTTDLAIEAAVAAVIERVEDRLKQGGCRS